MLLPSTAALSYTPLFHYSTTKISSISSGDAANSLYFPTDLQDISPIFPRAVDPFSSATAGPFWRDLISSVKRM